MTEEELRVIEARCNAATQGPWESGANCEHFLHIEHDEQSVFMIGYHFPNAENDTKFIVHARTDVPALIAEIRRLQGEEMELRAALVIERDCIDCGKQLKPVEVFFYGYGCESCMRIENESLNAERLPNSCHICDGAKSEAGT